MGGPRRACSSRTTGLCGSLIGSAIGRNPPGPFLVASGVAILVPPYHLAPSPLRATGKREGDGTFDGIAPSNSGGRRPGAHLGLGIAIVGDPGGQDASRLEPGARIGGSDG